MPKYNSSNIETVRFPDSVRMNTSLYLGSSDSHGRWVIARELLDNALDEFLANRNKNAAFVAQKDGSYWVIDSGGGIPQGTKTFTVNVNGKSIENKMPTMQAVFSELHTSGKFRSDAYKVSVGSHGLGSKATNATSEFFTVYTKFNEQWYSIGFEKGLLVSPVQKIKPPKGPNGKSLTRGTAIHFKPDPTIFSGSSVVDLKFAHSWAEITSYLNPGFTVVVQDQRGKQSIYVSKEGPSEYVTKILSDLKASAEEDRFLFKSELADVVVAFSNAEGMNIRGYTNGLFNSQGGKHVDSVCSAMLQALKPFAKKKQVLSAYDVKEGLCGIVNIKLHKAEFSSQDKSRLTDDRAGQDFASALEPEFKKFFTRHKALAVRLCEKASKLNDLRSQFKASKKIVQALNQVKKKGMPSKYAAYDARTRVEDRELLIVEGESASGGLREKRKPWQALCPMKGKIQNACKNGDKVLESEEVLMILGALGFDPKADDPYAKLAINKVICLADPDPDGCLKSDTRVMLCNGTTPTIKELSESYDGKPIWVWSMDANGNLRPALAYDPSVRCMRDQYVKLTLDDGSKITCTMNHPFAINYASDRKHVFSKKGVNYVYAQYLKPGDSLMSMYFKETTSEGWHLKNSENRYLSAIVHGKTTPVHKIVAEATQPSAFSAYKKANEGVMGGRYHIHHVDGNPRNNEPVNLSIISREEHYGQHGREMALTHNRTERHKKRVSMMNSSPEMKRLQHIGRAARIYLGMKASGIPYSRKSWKCCCLFAKGGMQQAFPIEYVPKSVVKEYVRANGLTVDDAYNVAYKHDVDKASYPTQKISKFVAFAYSVYLQYGELNEELYMSFRELGIKSNRIARGTPKWNTVVDELDTDDVLGFVLKSVQNHKVVSVKIVTDKEKRPFYCMTVPEYGNFLIADKNGNGICSSNCHINSLLLALFYKYLPRLFDEGRIFVADIPEFYAQYKQSLVLGDTVSEVQRKLLEAGAPKSTAVHHIKGWGEIDASLMEVLAVNKDTRRLIQIKPIEDRDHVDFVSCMNENVEFRRRMLALPENA